MGHHHHRDSIFDKIKRYFASKRHNAYLEQHGYYDSFDDRKYAKSPSSYPFLPYSLQDLLERRRICGLEILVASRRSTAHWFKRQGNSVTLARPSHSDGSISRVKHLGSYEEYDGPKLDILVWDSHKKIDDWEGFIDRNLAPRGVIILVYSNLFDAMEQGFGALGAYLTNKGMRMLDFQNPGPRREIITAELYYPDDNVLNI